MLVLLALGTVVWTMTRQSPPPVAAEIETTSHGQQVAFIVNPVKDVGGRLVETAREKCAAADLPEPLIRFTTVADPGAQQARDALEAGADVVVAAGGDGTVRSVAAGLVGSGVPMAIIPMGTGNLFARNLELPVNALDEAVEIALTGRDRVVDVGWARVTAAEVSEYGDSEDDWAQVGSQELFLVISGLGFDAAMVADTDDTLKRRMGWLAYFVAGMKHLNGPRLKADITIDDKIPVTAVLRTVMVGNCGLLPGNLTLLPDAKIDDGLLDVVAIDTRIGLAGWMQLFGEVVMQGAVEKPAEPKNDRWKMGQIDVAQGQRVQIRVEEGRQAQVDGDPMGRVLGLDVWVDPGALVVRAA